MSLNDQYEALRVRHGAASVAGMKNALDALDSDAVKHIADIKRELMTLENVVGAKVCARLHVAMAKAAASLETVVGVAAGTYGGIPKPPSSNV